MTDLAARLRDARRAAGYESAAAAARKFGWTPATYRHHENGTRGFDRDHAKAYGRAFRVSDAYLLGLTDLSSKDKMEEIRDILIEVSDPVGNYRDLNDVLTEQVDCRLVRVADFERIQEKGVYALFEQSDEYIPFPNALLGGLSKIKIEDIFVLHSLSAHMAPTIRADAIMLLDAGNTDPVRQDDIWLFSYGGMVTTRRLRFLGDGKCEAIADAREVPPIEIDTSTGQFSILAKVVWAGQSL